MNELLVNFAERQRRSPQELVKSFVALVARSESYAVIGAIILCALMVVFQIVRERAEAAHVADLQTQVSDPAFVQAVQQAQAANDTFAANAARLAQIRQAMRSGPDAARKLSVWMTRYPFPQAKVSQVTYVPPNLQGTGEVLTVDGTAMTQKFSDAAYRAIGGNSTYALTPRGRSAITYRIERTPATPTPSPAPTAPSGVQ